VLWWCWWYCEYLGSVYCGIGNYLDIISDIISIE
jgi:hypothetical protein